jgi:hypothetical protein
MPWFSVTRVTVQSEVCSVRNQALLIRADGIEDPFPGERFLFENTETAAIESDTRQVGEPQCPLRTRQAGALIPDGNLPGRDGSLHDGNQRRPVLLNSDRLFELIFKGLRRNLWVT